MMQYVMQEYQNKGLHIGKAGLNQEEANSIIKAILKEFMIGLGNLSSNYVSLFKGHVNNIIKQSSNVKMQQLVSI